MPGEDTVIAIPHCVPGAPKQSRSAHEYRKLKHELIWGLTQCFTARCVIKIEPNCLIE
jgi:hypothetical protein